MLSSMDDWFGQPALSVGLFSERAEETVWGEDEMNIQPEQSS